MLETSSISRGISAVVYMYTKALSNKTKIMTKILGMMSQKHSTYLRLKVGRTTAVSSSAIKVISSWTLRTTRRKVCP